MPRRRDLNADEADLWRHVMKDVERLPGREFQSTPSRDNSLRPLVRPGAAKPPVVPVFPKDPPSRPVPAMPPLSHGESTGLDRKTLTRMRQGKLSVEGRLDLHGMTQEEAHSALLSFILSASSRGKRCVLVITGKGLRQDGEVGILRRNVPHWLNRAPLRSQILAFSYAHRKDGGEGALYVLLKRKRP